MQNLNLNTQERFLVLAQHPEKGRFVISDIQLNFGIIGAILLDLTVNDEIKIENDILTTTGKSGSTNKNNHEVLSIISSSTKQRKVKTWLSKLARKSRYFKWEIIKNLETMNIIKVEQKRFLGLIPYRRCYLTDKQFRGELLNNLRNQVLFKTDFIPADLVLLGLVEACQMHKHLAKDRQELKTIKEKLKKIIKDNPIASGVSETIRQVQAAVITGVVAATTAATTSASH